MSTQFPTCGRVTCERKRRSDQLAAAKERRRLSPLCPRCCLHRTGGKRFCSRCRTEVAVKTNLTKMETRRKKAQADAVRAKQVADAPKPRPTPAVRPVFDPNLME